MGRKLLSYTFLKAFKSIDKLRVIMIVEYQRCDLAIIVNRMKRHNHYNLDVKPENFESPSAEVYILGRIIALEEDSIFMSKI